MELDFFKTCFENCIDFGSMDRLEKPIGGGYKVFVTTSDKSGAGTGL